MYIYIYECLNDTHFSCHSKLLSTERIVLKNLDLFRLCPPQYFMIPH